MPYEAILDKGEFFARFEAGNNDEAVRMAKEAARLFSLRGRMKVVARDMSLGMCRVVAEWEEGGNQRSGDDPLVLAILHLVECLRNERGVDV